MRSNARRPWLAALAVPLILLSSLPASASCLDPFGRQLGPTGFDFVTSKPEQVAPGEITVTPTSLRDTFGMMATVSATTAMEALGTKRSQRSEILETGSGAARTDTGAFDCYAWSVALPDETPLPASGGTRAKLTIAQFHQNMASQSGEPAVLLFDLDPDGNLVAEFNDPVGRRSTVLVPGGPSGRDALGKEWEFEVSVKWATTAAGEVIVRLRERGQGAFRQVMDDRGQNATAGAVYLKLGVYRHNIERDPAFAASTVTALYRDIARNGMKAQYRGQSGATVSPPAAGTLGMPSVATPSTTVSASTPVASAATPSMAVMRSAPVVSRAVRMGVPGSGGGALRGMTVASY